MWWRRRPGGTLGIPAPRVAEFRIGAGLWITIAVLGILVPMLGLSLVLLALVDLVRRGTTRSG
jgi:sulfite reductase (NADPH) flavoprotein alpha-component